MNKGTTIYIVSVVMIFKIFGLLPFSLIEWEESKFVVHISTSKISIIYNLILSITMTYTTGVNGLPRIIEDYKNKNDSKSVSDVLDIVGCAMGASTCIIIWIQFSLNHEKMQKTAREFLEIDSFVQRHHIEQLQFKLWPLITVTCIYVLLWLVLIPCEWMAYDRRMDWFTWTFLYVINLIPLGLTTLQYGLIMHLMNFRLELLNTAIEKISTEEILPKYQIVFVRNIDEDDVTVENFQSIKCAHEMLYNLTIAISNFYSFPILLIMGNACFFVINIVCDTIVNILESSNTRISFAISISIWFVVTAAPIIILISALGNFTKEYQRTPILISKLKSRFEDCPRLSFEAQWFLHGFLYKPMEFTALGFFKLDHTFFKSILGTTITYLIIVLQFRKSNSKEGQ